MSQPAANQPFPVRLSDGTYLRDPDGRWVRHIDVPGTDQLRRMESVELPVMAQALTRLAERRAEDARVEALLLAAHAFEDRDEAILETARQSAADAGAAIEAAALARALARVQAVRAAVAPR